MRLLLTMPLVSIVLLETKVFGRHRWCNIVLLCSSNHCWSTGKSHASWFRWRVAHPNQQHHPSRVDSGPRNTTSNGMDEASDCCEFHNIYDTNNSILLETGTRVVGPLHHFVSRLWISKWGEVEQKKIPEQNCRRNQNIWRRNSLAGRTSNILLD